MASISILLSCFCFLFRRRNNNKNIAADLIWLPPQLMLKLLPRLPLPPPRSGYLCNFQIEFQVFFCHACVSMFSIFTSDYFAVFLTSQNVFSYQPVKFAKKKPKKRVALRLNRWRVSRVGFVQKFLITKTYRWNGTTSMSAGTRFVNIGYINRLGLSLARSIIIVVWLTNKNTPHLSQAFNCGAAEKKKELI